MTESILDVDDVEGTRMTFTSNDRANSPQVTTTGDHAQVARFKLDEVHNFVGGDVELNSVVNFHQRIGVTDGAAVMGCNEGNALWTNLDSSYFAKLVLQRKMLMKYSVISIDSIYFGFLSSNSVDGKSTLDIVDQAEKFTSLFNGDDICEKNTPFTTEYIKLS